MENGLPPEETTRVAHATRLAVVDLMTGKIHRQYLTDEI
jgi:hypothetical protein